MNLQNKKLLILGAGRGQKGLYKAAKSLGIQTIAGTMPGDNLPCLALADEVCYMNIADSTEVMEKVKEISFDGVATCCLDTGIISLGKVCDAFHLTGLSAESALMCNSKLDMKDAFLKNDVSTAKFKRVNSIAELTEAVTLLNFPVIIKATDLQGSNGIYIAKNETEAVNGFKNAMKLTKKDYCIVEEFIEGWEFGAQAFVYNNEVIFVMPHGDDTFMSHTAVPVGHYVPLECSDDILMKIEEEVVKAIKALNLNNCAVNVDLICKDDKIYLIELTGRVGANCLPELVEIYYGIEYYKMIALMALGENPLEFWNSKKEKKMAGYAKMIFSKDESGKLKSFEDTSKAIKNLVELTYFVNSGDDVRQFENSNDCLGQIIVNGSTLDDCKKIIENFEHSLKINFEEE